MLKIRLQRVGRKHDPYFRVVLSDARRSAKSGKCLEILGNYDARKNLSKLENDRIKYWLLKGAQVSDTVYNLLIDSKIIEGKKKSFLLRPKAVAEKARGEEPKEKMAKKE